MSRGPGRWRFSFEGIGRARRAARLNKAADQAAERNDYRAAVTQYEESLTLFRQQENWNGVLWVRSKLGTLAWQSQDYKTARSHFEQCVSLSRRIQSAEALAGSLNGLAAVASHQGEFELADKLCRESLELWRKREHASGIAATYQLLGSIAPNSDEARTHFENALALYREHNDAKGVASALVSLGHSAAPDRDNARESAALEECRQLCQVSGNTQTLAYALNNLGNIERYAGNLADTEALYRESLRLKQEIGDRWAIAYTLEGCAALATARKQGERAAQLFGAAAAIRESLGAPLERSKRAEYEANVTAARALLDPETFESAWQEGKAFSLSQAVACASKRFAENA